MFMALTLLPRERQNLFFHGWKLAQSLESLVKIKENETLILTKQGCVRIKGKTYKASNNMHLQLGPRASCKDLTLL